MDGDSFTSTSVLGLLYRAAVETDASLVEGIARPDPLQRAVTPDADKRELIGRLMRAGGPAALLKVGQFLRSADETPVLTVLVDSSSPMVLADNWMRLERYQHAAHRTMILQSGEHRWICSRTSEASPSSLGEDSLIAGVLMGLLARIGLDEVRLEVGKRVIAPPALADGGSIDDLSRFSISWEPFASRSAARDFNDTHASTSDRLTSLLASEIGRAWRLGEAAQCLAMSERSLQRRLSREKQTFSNVLRRARMRQATALLTGSRAALAEVGYCCGYADQAHFQREFLRMTNVTPRNFREIGSDRLA